MTAMSSDMPTRFLSRILTSNKRTAQSPHSDSLPEVRRVFENGQRGLSYDKIFGPYLAEARRIILIDPYIQKFHQVRNLMELLETIVRYKAPEQQVEFLLRTSQSESRFADKQASFLQQIADNAPSVGIEFSWEILPNLHDRTIQTDHGWTIALGRGLDFFGWYDVNNAFDFQNRLQVCREVLGFSLMIYRTQITA